MVKPSYFEQEEADQDDAILKMCQQQGYVPSTCLLGGSVVWGLVMAGSSPCYGCACDRAKCKGKPWSDC